MRRRHLRRVSRGGGWGGGGVGLTRAPRPGAGGRRGGAAALSACFIRIFKSARQRDLQLKTPERFLKEEN